MSPTAPKVATVITWVNPLVNKPVPWVLGSKSTSHEIFLISSKALPSGLLEWFKSISLTTSFCML